MVVSAASAAYGKLQPSVWNWSKQNRTEHLLVALPLHAYLQDLHTLCYLLFTLIVILGMNIKY